MKNNQSGFSLIELIIVVTIIGVIAAIAIPSLQKGIRAAENGSAVSTLKGMSSNQSVFYSQNNRFATMSELHTRNPAGFGTLINGGTAIVKGFFTYEMSPLSPSPEQLKTSYTITASRAGSGGDVPFIFRMTQNGEVVQITP